MQNTLFKRIMERAEAAPGSLAILAPARNPITYARLGSEVRAACAVLRQAGMAPGVPVALALPNTPETILTFLAVSEIAAAVMINPAAPLAETAALLAGAGAQAVIVPEGIDSPARQAALQSGIALLELSSRPQDPTRMLSLSLHAGGGGFNPVLPPEIAALIFTSGTTSLPRAVQLTHQNILANMAGFTQALNLSPADRALNISPLFHTMGLVVACLAPMFSGGSAICAPGFEPAAFFEWLADLQPTWFSATPTTLQAILHHAPQHREQIARHHLRYLRCSAAALPLSIQEKLEQVFKVPVLSAYGMTEAAGAITSNLLETGRNKKGSVGLPLTGRVAIMDVKSAGFLPERVVGEIVIQGPAVTPGYHNAPEANARNFVNGWLRTGDLGHLDGDGFLFITGRLKEMILRGGENISPIEVEQALYLHPAVRQAAVFGVADDQLGESLAAAVVLNDPPASEQELRRFLAGRLASSKVPEQIIFLEDLPKSPTGKLQRAALPQLLAEHLRPRPVPAGSKPRPPEGELEQFLAGLWRETLAVEEVPANHSFSELGGDSLLAARLANRLVQRLGIEISLVDLFEMPTIADQALLLEKLLS